MTNSKDKKMKKKLECGVKRNVWHNNLCALVWQAIAASSIACFVSCPTLSSCFPMSVLLFCLRLPALRFFYPSVPALFFVLNCPLCYYLIFLYSICYFVFLCSLCCFLLYPLYCLSLFSCQRVDLCQFQLQLGLHFQLSEY